MTAGTRSRDSARPHAFRVIFDDVTLAVGKGLVAGLAGTAIMTLASALEMKVTHRPASSTPAAAAGKVLGVAPTGDTEKVRFSNLVHWGYGTGLGVVRGLIGMAGLKGQAAALADFAAVWGAELIMLPSLGAASPIWTWTPRQIATDILEHLVYASATSAAYELIDR